jgi:hypothetical protein
MVETTSVREEKPKLSAKDRLCLIQTINALPQTQFDELVFALNPPKGVVASSTAAQGTRSKDLLDWLEGSSGPGLAAADEVLQVLIPKATKTAPQPVAFVMMGRMGDLTPGELEAIAELLRQKTGDPSIALAFSREGSIKLILNGSPEGLTKLQELFEAGELEQLNIPSVEAVAPADSSTQDARKTRLIQALRLSYGRVNRNLDLTLANNLGSASASALVSDLASYRVYDIDSARDLAYDLERARDLVNARNFTSDRDIDRDLAGTLGRAMARANHLADDLARASELVRDLGRDLDLVFTHINDLVRARDLNLSNADLSGANLRDLDLVGANLTNADLTKADVTGTRFGNNSGLPDTDKRNLQSRGAIFLDLPI